MKRWLIFALVLLLISGCGAAENTVPPLMEFAGLTGTEAGERLSGLNRDELISAWGEADGHCSGLFCDFYDIGGDRYLGIYYDGNACVESVKIFEKEEPEEEKSNEVSCELDHMNISLELPESWEYACSGFGVYNEEIHVQPADVVGIHFWPKEEPDAVFMLNFYRYGLGLCGTGAEFEPFELENGLSGTVRRETFSGGSLSLFYIFEGLPGDYAMETLLDPADWEEWGEKALEILSTAQLGKGYLTETEAIAAAEEVCTVEHDMVRAYFDAHTGCWEVMFSLKDTAGGDQVVTVDAEGKILGSIYGE